MQHVFRDAVRVWACALRAALVSLQACLRMGTPLGRAFPLYSDKGAGVAQQHHESHCVTANALCTGSISPRTPTWSTLKSVAGPVADVYLVSAFVADCPARNYVSVCPVEVAVISVRPRLLA
jgi:hypothetical protein